MIFLSYVAGHLDRVNLVTETLVSRTCSQIHCVHMSVYEFYINMQRLL